MKYYTYISASKVEMLFHQIPGATQKKVASQLKFNLKVVSGQIGTERQAYDNLVAKLKMVETYLKSAGEIGDVNSGSQWIMLKMKVRPFTFSNSENVWGIVWVGMEDGKLIGLCGSGHNIVGSMKQTPPTYSFSYLPSIIKWLGTYEELLTERFLALTDIEGNALLSEGIASVPGDPPWVRAVKRLHTNPDHPEESIETIVRRLTVHSNRENTTIMATPLWVTSS